MVLLGMLWPAERMCMQCTACAQAALSFSATTIHAFRSTFTLHVCPQLYSLRKAWHQIRLTPVQVLQLRRDGNFPFLLWKDTAPQHFESTFGEYPQVSFTKIPLTHYSYKWLSAVSLPGAFIGSI